MTESLQPRLVDGLQATYIEAVWPGENTSGLRALGKNVLVRMDECSPRSAGGVELPSTFVENMTEASETGCVYGRGAAAFRHFDDGAPWVGESVEVGERVYVARYSGVKCMGADGGIYRMMDFGCIVSALDHDYLRRKGVLAVDHAKAQGPTSRLSDAALEATGRGKQRKQA